MLTIWECQHDGCKRERFPGSKRSAEPIASAVGSTVRLHPAS
jgi:hypothetical protein